MKVNVSGYSGRHSGTGQYGISLYVIVPDNMEPDQVKRMTEVANELESALGYLAGVCVGGTHPNEHHPAMKQARSALAKARGKT
jgi:hypothetical protein